MPDGNLIYRRGKIRRLTLPIDVRQIRAVNSSRILGLVGVLEEQYWESIRAALNVVLGF